MKINELTYFLPEEEQQLNEILRKLLPPKMIPKYDELKEPQHFLKALVDLKRAIEKDDEDNPLWRISQEYGISPRSLQIIAKKQGIMETRSVDVPYMGWVTNEGKFITGDHFDIIRKYFLTDEELEKNGVSDIHDMGEEQVYDYGFREGWIRVGNASGEIYFDEAGVTKKAFRTLVKIIRDNPNATFSHRAHSLSGREAIASLRNSLI